jgi:hypothetical protein
VPFVPGVIEEKGTSPCAVSGSWKTSSIAGHSMKTVPSCLRPALSLRRQGVEPRRPLPFAGRMRLLWHDIPAPPTMD